MLVVGLLLMCLGMIGWCLYEIDTLEKSEKKWRVLALKLQEKIRTVKAEGEIDGRYNAVTNHIAGLTTPSCCCAEHYGEGWYAGACPACPEHNVTDEELLRRYSEAYGFRSNADLDAEIHQFFDEQ